MHFLPCSGLRGASTGLVQQTVQIVASHDLTLVVMRHLLEAASSVRFRPIAVILKLAKIPIGLGAVSAQPAPLAPDARPRMGQLDCNMRSIQTHSTGLAMSTAEKSIGACVLPLQSRSQPAMTGAMVMPA